MKKLLMLLLCSFIFTQEVDSLSVEEVVVPCEGTCLSEEESINITNNIQELQFNLDKQLKMNENLNSQIYIYIQQDELNKQKSILLNDKIKLYNELVKQVKPKWYENKWLWFTIGVVTTAGTLKLASDIVD